MSAFKKLVVGLGNPGDEYKNTRHNAGFMVVDAAAAALGLHWAVKKSWDAEFASAGWLKPQRYMNQSGTVVAAVLRQQTDWLKVLPKTQPKRQPRILHQLLVAFDDLDIPLGSFKLQFGTGPKVHNGVASVREALGTDQFWYLRLGVDGRQGDRTISGSDYVLQSFRPDERPVFDSELESAKQELLRWWDAQIS